MAYYFFFDTETTGLDPEVHEIIQIAGILTDPEYNLIKEAKANLMPRDWTKASPEALQVNGVNPATWKATYPNTGMALDRIYSFIFNNVPDGEKIGLVGYNVEFDIGFLKSLMRKENRKFYFSLKYTLDVMQMVQFWATVTGVELGSSYKLVDICAKLGIDNGDAHDAFADIKMTHKLMCYMRDDIRDKMNGARNIFNNTTP